MGKNSLQGKLRKFRRFIAVVLCVMMAAETGVSSLAESGSFIWIPLSTDSNAPAAGTGEEEPEDSRVVIASWPDAALSDATASDAVSWQAGLQARIDALPGIQEIREDETNELLVDTYWEVLDIMDVLKDQVGVTVYDSIMDADDGSIEGADEMDVSRLYEIADYVMAAYAALNTSGQLGDLTFVTEDVITIEPYGYEGEITMTLEVTGDYDVAASDDDHDCDYFSFYTGETLTLDFTIDGVGPPDYDYRIYFKPSDPAGLYDEIPDTGIYEGYEGIEKQLVFYGLTGYTLPDGDLKGGEVYGLLEVGDYTASWMWDEDAGAWYLDFSGISQDGTLAGTLQVTFPSGRTPGGDLIIFGVICENENIVSTGTEGFDAGWKTQPETFQAELSLDAAQAESGLILQADGSGGTYVAVRDNPDQDMIYTITMENTTGESVTDENIGEDLILDIDVTHTITLPDGIKVGADVFVGQETGSGGVEFISDGTTDGAILTLRNSSGIRPGGYLLTCDDDTNTLTLTWRIGNSAADDCGFPESQIECGVWEVRLNGKYLLLDDEDAFNAAGAHEITGTVRYQYSYTWSGDLENEDTEVLTIAGPSSNVVLTKTADRSGGNLYMGEDAFYTITLYNQGVYATTDLSRLADDRLDATQYITPVNIWNMFFGDESDTTGNLAEDSGGYLTIAVTGAMVYYDTPLDLADLDVLSDMDGNATVYKSVANFDMDGRSAKYTDAVITMAREDADSISVVFSSGGAAFYSAAADSAVGLKELFLRIGYVVTASAKYSVSWDLAGQQLAGGETRNYKVYSTFKNTFQYWEGLYQKHASDINKATNTVTLYYDNGGKAEGDDGYRNPGYAQADYTLVLCDFEVEKDISEIDGDADADTDCFYRGSIVTYMLAVQHYGNGVAEDLPLIDAVSGSQLLLAPVTDVNIASAGAGNWPISSTVFTDSSRWVTYDGQNYCPLTTRGTYDNVWLDSDHCAATVVVDTIYYNSSSSNNYPNSINYTITWNYDTIDGPQGSAVTYRMQVGSQERVTSVHNIVYLNGIYKGENDSTCHTSALYDEIGSTEIRSGSLKKQILTSDWGVDAEEETYAYSGVLDPDEDMTTVCYKLELNAKGGNGALTFEDVKDILPYTYGVFDWDDTNVTVLSSSYVNPDSDDDTPDFEDKEPEIVCCDADGNRIADADVAAYISRYGETPYQMISWGDVILPENRQGIRIYVKLEFPTDNWEAYAGKVRGYLKNTLTAVIENAADKSAVIHSVKKDAKAYLQEGVFWISSPTGTTVFVSDSTSREIYSNSSANARDGSLVAYYIQLYNASSSRLYLADIQDVVPEGFEPAALYSGVSDYEAGNGIAPGSTLAADTGSPASCLRDENGDEIFGVTWVPAAVRSYTGEDGVLRYKVTTSKTDEATGYSYLEEGEAVSFIAEFRVGTESETEDYAVNKIGMPYVTLSGESLSAAANVNGEAEEMSVNYSSLDQNVGGCRILSEPDEREYEGFRAEIPPTGEVNQWLFSEVTVHRGEIIPGIHKSLATDDSGGVNGNEAVDWQIEVTNDGTTEMVNYTITDSVDSPFRIRGDVYYEICDADGKSVLTAKNYADEYLYVTDYEDSSSNLPLFSVKRSSEDTFDITWNQIVNQAVTEVTASGKEPGETVSIDPPLYVFHPYWGDMYSCADDAAIEVTIDQDSDGNDYVSIDFTGPDLKIPAGGRATLKIRTQTPDTVTAGRGTYYNIAAVIPVQSYDDKLVTVGEAVSASESDTGAAYIRSGDQVHVSNGYSTNAQKWVQSMEDSTKIAGSEVENVSVNYIDLTGMDESFTYTLEVTNALSTPMTSLVIVDTLPEPGDYAPFTNPDRTQRGSGFRVDLLTDHPGWYVIKGMKTDETDDTAGDISASDTLDKDSITEVSSEAGDGEYYTVHYSTSSDLGLGLTGNDCWSLDSDHVDWRDDPAGARAVRIEIHNAGIRPGQAVQVSFHAAISSESEDTAKPGGTGWNSFAYQYTTSAGEAATTLWAATRKVGVRLPGVPWLTKKLVGVDKEAETALEDQTFRFLVHAGEQLTDFDYSDNSDGELETRLKAALDEAGRAYVVKELTVDVSEGAAESILLDDPDGNLTYTDQAEYTLAELPYHDSPGPGNDRFVPGSLHAGSNYTTGNVITFLYSKSGVVEIVAANKSIDWWLDICKQDEDTGAALEGAVFGLYSKTDPGDDRTLDEEYEELLAGLTDAYRFPLESEDGQDTETWYLIDVKETDENGAIRWEGLTDSVYCLKELKAPDGYYLPADPIRVDYWQTDTGNTEEDTYYSRSGNESGTIITVTVNNRIGYTLPKSGGRGTLWFRMFGLLIMCMGVSLTYITKREKIGSGKK